MILFIECIISNNKKYFTNRFKICDNNFISELLFENMHIATSQAFCKIRKQVPNILHSKNVHLLSRN